MSYLYYNPVSMKASLTLLGALASSTLATGLVNGIYYDEYESISR